METIKNLIVNHKTVSTVSLWTVINFGWSFFSYWHGHFKDRAKLTTSSRFFTKAGSVRVKVVNEGRRPITLTALGIDYEDGSEGGEMLNYPSGITLNENDPYIQDFEDICSSLYQYESDTGAVNIWFLDTRDRKYYVKGAKKNLKRYWKGVGWKQPSIWTSLRASVQDLVLKFNSILIPFY